MMLGLLRRIPEQRCWRSPRRVEPHGTAHAVAASGCTVGSVGYGHIGRLVARRLAGFDVELLVSDPALGDSDSPRPVELGELLARSDIVSLHVPLIPATRHLIDQAALQLMRPHAVLVNMSRGGVVDEAALIQALNEGVIAGAALDVFETEPPGDSPLLSMRNVVVSPHNGGLSTKSVDLMLRIATASVIDILEDVASGSGEPGNPRLGKLPALLVLVQRSTWDDDHGSVGLLVDRDRGAVKLAERFGAQHVGGVSHRHEVTFVQQCQAIGVETGQCQVVHRRHNGEAMFSSQPIDQLESLLLMADVEGAGWLVEKQHGGLLGQGPGDHQSLPLASAEGSEVATREGDEVEALEHVVNHRPVVARLVTEVADVRATTQEDVFERCHVVGHQRRLRNVGDQRGAALEPTGSTAACRRSR